MDKSTEEIPINNESNQCQILDTVLKVNRLTLQSSQNEKISSESQRLNEEPNENKKVNNSSQLSSQASLIVEIRIDVIKIINEIAKQDNSLQGLKQTIEEIARNMLKKTEPYRSETEQFSEVFENAPSSIINNEMMKKQREIELLDTHSQQLQEKIVQYEKQIKQISQNAKILAQKYKNRTKQLKKAQSRIAFLQKKQLKQQERHQQLIQEYERSITALNQNLKLKKSDQLNNIFEAHSQNIAELKHIFNDHQSSVSQKKESESMLLSPDSCEIIKKIVTSSETIERRLKFIKREIKRSKLAEQRQTLSKKVQKKVQEQIQEQEIASQNSYDSDGNYQLALEHFQGELK